MSVREFEWQNKAQAADEVIAEIAFVQCSTVLATHAPFRLWLALEGIATVLVAAFTFVVTWPTPVALFLVSAVAAVCFSGGALRFLLTEMSAVSGFADGGTMSTRGASPPTALRAVDFVRAIRRLGLREKIGGRLRLMARQHSAESVTGFDGIRLVTSTAVSWQI